MACCRNGCLHGGEECSNIVCPEQWKVDDLAQKKFVDPDLTFWLRDADNLCTYEQEPITEVT